MGGTIGTTFWRMVAAVVQHAAERELFVAGEIAAANGPNKLGVQSETGGQNRTFRCVQTMSALPPKADIEFLDLASERACAQFFERAHGPRL